MKISARFSFLGLAAARKLSDGNDIHAISGILESPDFLAKLVEVAQKPDKEILEIKQKCHPILGFQDKRGNCWCKEGYVGDGILCLDLNECDFAGFGIYPEIDNCHGTCVNTEGSFYCKRNDEKVLSLIRD